MLPPLTTPTSILSTNSFQPVSTHINPPLTQPSQPCALPGDICTTILYANCNKGAEVSADSIDIFIDLVQANINSTSINLNFIFNQIYQNNLPPPIKRYFTDVYFFCLHKDPLDKSKLRPLGIPTAIRRLITSHVAVDCSKGAIAVSLGQKVVLSFNGYWGKRSE